MTTLLDTPASTLSEQNIHLTGLRFEPSPGTRDLNAVSRTAEAPAADEWLEQLSDRLSELAQLRPGWDAISALPVDPTLMDVVFKFASSDLILNLTHKPQLVPTINGGLALEWHTESIDMIIELSPDSEASIYYRDEDSDEDAEGLLREHTQALARAIVKLGYRS